MGGSDLLSESDYNKIKFRDSSFRFVEEEPIDAIHGRDCVGHGIFSR